MFKSLTCLRVADTWEHPGVPALDEQLSRRVFHPCGPTERLRAGWVPPRGAAHGPLAESVGGQVLMKLRVESRLLPASAVRQEVELRLDAIEDETGRRLRGKRKKELKEQVEHELLPRAFTRQGETLVWLDPQARRLVIGTTTSRLLDLVTTELSEAFDGTLPIAPLHTALSPSVAMGHWLLDGEAPAGFTVDQDCVLRAPDDSRATVRYARHRLDHAQVVEHVREGKLPLQLALTWADRVSCLLTDGMHLKRLQFPELESEGAQAGSGRRASGKDDAFDANAALVTGDLSRLLADLIEALGGEALPGSPGVASSPAPSEPVGDAGSQLQSDSPPAAGVFL
jgi:recombination associated protein RdgC